jgi:hypothetical protein
MLALVCCWLAPLSGCQIVAGVLMILKGFPKEDCDFKTQTNGRRLDEKDKKVVILCSSEPAAQAEHPSLDADVISELSRRFRSQEINVVDSHKITRWIDDNGGVTDDTDVSEIAGTFGADFVVLLKFQEFGFREQNSINLYRGHARGMVSVIELKRASAGSKPVARQIYNRPFDSMFPSQSRAPVSADQEKPSVFKQRYLTQLSLQLARMFYDHRPEDTI